MLINLSNHPSENWSEQQLQEAERQFGNIVDLQFPNILPDINLEQIIQLAKQYIQICFREFHKNPSDLHQNAVHVMGEMTFVYQFVRLISEHGVLCVASTTRRIVVKQENNKKISKFEFVKFRPYNLELY